MRIELADFPDVTIKFLADLAFTQRKKSGPVFWQPLEDAATAEQSGRLRAGRGEQAESMGFHEDGRIPNTGVGNLCYPKESTVGFEVPVLDAESTSRVVDVLRYVRGELCPPSQPEGIGPDPEKSAAAAMLCSVLVAELMRSLDERLRAAKQKPN
jgi:hypothetical protein